MVSDTSKDQSQPMRKKYWSELDVDRKMGRMRSEVKQIKARQESLSAVLDELRVHTHASDGSILIPLHSPYGQGEVARRLPEKDDEVYF